MKQAVIFDLDGVLVHTDRLHYLAWKDLADRQGIYFDETINHRLRGISRMASLDIVLERSTRSYSPAEKEAMAAEKNQVYRALVAEMSPADVEQDTLRTLKELRARGIKLALGSGSKNARLILARTGLEECLDAVVDGVSITRAKPDPEVFLKAAEALGVDPGDALVVEDAPAGIRAAHDGGFTSAGISEAASDPLTDHPIRQISDVLKLV